MRQPHDYSQERSRLAGAQLKICLLATVFAAATLPAGSALARAYHSQSLDGLIARCSAVNTTTLPAASLKQYEVEPDPETGLLSCVVQHQMPGAEPDNVQAQVEATYHPIAQPPEAIRMREVRRGDLVTYLGTYPVRSEYPLQFNITLAVPDVGNVEMHFTDQQATR